LRDPQAGSSQVPGWGRGFGEEEFEPPPHVAIIGQVDSPVAVSLNASLA